MKLLQSENGGVPGWEPATGASWLEVNALTYSFKRYFYHIYC